MKQGRRTDTVEEEEYIPIMLSYGGRQLVIYNLKHTQTTLLRFYGELTTLIAYVGAKPSSSAGHVQLFLSSQSLDAQAGAFQNPQTALNPDS